RRVAATLLLLDLGDGPRRAIEPAEDLVDARTGVEGKLLPHLLAVGLDQPGHEHRRLSRLEPRLARPVLRRDEGADLALAPDDEADGARLHATRRQTAAHLLPQQRREPVPDQAVQHATGLLRLEEILVQVARMLDGLLHGLLRDLVEEDAANVAALRVSELLGDVPGDRLALAI